MAMFTYSRTPALAFAAALGVLTAGLAVAREGETVVFNDLRHLRSGGGDVPEWTEFAAADPGSRAVFHFQARANSADQTLFLRQRDVKETWSVQVNGKRVGKLTRDENEMRVAFTIPAGALKDGENELVVTSTARKVDDIEVGDIRTLARGVDAALREGRVTVTVVDAERGTPIPARITILDERGYLAPVGARSTERLAVRTGVVYTADGTAQFGLAAGRYTVFASRGFEYSVASSQVMILRGQPVALRLKLRREVPTPGLVACDTHIHTLTHSGHGDATIEERVIALAGEGVELPIATDHNVHIDYDATARKLGVRRWFTPVAGNEVTTPVGHFNIFPIASGAPVPEWRVKDWATALANIRKTPGVRVVILNHPRDVHAKVRPFGPERHLSVVGENLDGWKLDTTAVELVNSGAMQTDGFLVLRDWFGHLNRGRRLLALGASDSHDVTRYIVGQGRTYIRCDDRDAGKIDVEAACRSVVDGRVSVSLGLLTRIRVDDRYAAGDLVPAQPTVKVDVEVLGPSWSRAERVFLFANGAQIREARIPASGGDAAGVKWRGTWQVPLRHDVHLVAVATGPGVRGLFWRIPKPYQPTSAAWRPYVMGVTGVVWLDRDGDGAFTSAHDYAQRVFEESGRKTDVLLRSLAPYDEAVAAQAANLFRRANADLDGGKLAERLASIAQRAPTPAVRRGWERFVKEWKGSRR